MQTVTHLGQYWSARHREVRLLGARFAAPGPNARPGGEAWDLTDALPLPRYRRRFREEHRGAPWQRVSWTYASLPLPALELAELAEERGSSPGELLAGALERRRGECFEVDWRSLDRAPREDRDHLVAPIVPRRAQAFGVTYLDSALERGAEGQRADYSYVYRAVKERGERPEIFLKATAPEHIVGPRGFMGLRRDLTNSEAIDGTPTPRVTVGAGIEPELAAAVRADGTIWGYTLADDVSGNRIENETLLYLAQAKHFTGGLVLGPWIRLASDQENPAIEITARIFAPGGEKLFERSTNTARLNAPLASLIAWARSHVQLHPGEVFSTGTGMVPEGEVKVLQEGMAVEIAAAEIGSLWHGARTIPAAGDLNLDHSRLELGGRGT